MRHDPSSRTIDTSELRAMLESGEPVTVLDVRPAAERDEWAIPGSLHIDAYDALKAGESSALADIALPRNRPVVTVCGAGRTSVIAMELLRARGYDARSLRGGMKAWSLAWNSALVPLPGSDATVIQVRRTGKGCLSYLAASRGEAAVIDAALDPGIYVELARRSGWVITHVLDTHIHADHLSRSRRLAELTGATLLLPAQERVTYPYQPLHDGDTLRIGTVAIRAVATPGHTAESMSYRLDDQSLVTGDTLFLAGVGRPDLEASAGEAHGRARLLFRSLQRLMALPAGMIILPGHTSEPVPFDGHPVMATLGDVMVHAGMLHLSEPEFVATILSRLPPAPPNHARIVACNEAGTMPAGDATDLEAGANRCAVA